jgi:hypothetical protein
MSLVLLFNQYEAPISCTITAVQAPAVVSAVMVGSVVGTGTVNAGTSLRTYGRINQVNGMGGTWVEVTTDQNGYADQVYFTTLCQVLKLNLNESPFFANYGIPAQQSVITQVFPDYYATATQTQFAPYFASLVITRIQGSNPPVYSAMALCHSGAVLSAMVPT